MLNLLRAAGVASLLDSRHGADARYRVTDPSGFEMSLNSWRIGLLYAGRAVLLTGMVIELSIGDGGWEELAL